MNNIWDKVSLSKALNIKIDHEITVGPLEFDSRKIKGGELFVAFTGGVTDGHLFVQDALARGAAAALVSHLPAGVERNKAILVKDTYEALVKLAEYKRSISKAKFIGVTGSVGKTSTKNAIACVLRAHAKTFFSQGNFNNHLGLPLNLASMPDDIEFAVIEMGMNNPGEISILTKLAKPHIAIITNVEPVHIEFFNSIEDIFHAKCEILEGLDKDGIAIINADSPWFSKFSEVLNRKKIHRVYTFGHANKGDVTLTDMSHQGSSMIANYNIMGTSTEVKTNITGIHQAINIGIALLISKILGLNIEKSKLALRDLQPEKGRGLLGRLRLIGNKEVTIVNDSYNANVPSVTAALANIKHIPGRRKVTILADMYELGDHTQSFHESLRQPIIDNNIDLVLTVGKFMRYLHEKLPDSINKKHFDNLEQLKVNILQCLEDQDVILFKGSKGTKLHMFVDEFINQNNKENVI